MPALDAGFAASGFRFVLGWFWHGPGGTGFGRSVGVEPFFLRPVTIGAAVAFKDVIYFLFQP